MGLPSTSDGQDRKQRGGLRPAQICTRQVPRDGSLGSNTNLLPGSCRAECVAPAVTLGDNTPTATMSRKSPERLNDASPRSEGRGSQSEGPQSEGTGIPEREQRSLQSKGTGVPWSEGREVLCSEGTEVPRAKAERVPGARAQGSRQDQPQRQTNLQRPEASSSFGEE